MNKQKLTKNLESIGEDITSMTEAGLNLSEAIAILILIESRINQLFSGIA